MNHFLQTRSTCQGIFRLLFHVQRFKIFNRNPQFHAAVHMKSPRDTLSPVQLTLRIFPHVWWELEMRGKASEQERE